MMGILSPSSPAVRNNMAGMSDKVASYSSSGGNESSVSASAGCGTGGNGNSGSGSSGCGTGGNGNSGSVSSGCGTGGNGSSGRSTSSRFKFRLGSRKCRVKSSADNNPSKDTKRVCITPVDVATSGKSNSIAPDALSASAVIPDALNVPVENSDRTGAGLFSASQLETLKEAFAFFDLDADGRISSGELRKVLRFFGSRVTERDAMAMIADVDCNRNGTVEFNEFLDMMSAYYLRSELGAGLQGRSTAEVEALEAFQALDHNGDSYVDFDELKRTMMFLGEPRIADEDVRSMILEADIDGDGRIDFGEFKRLMKAMEKKIAAEVSNES